MSNDVNITESDLHAYIDGELEAGRAQAVAAGLSADPALAERLAAYQADMAMLKKLYGPMAEQQPGRPYLALVENARPRPAMSRRLVGAIAAAALIALAVSPFAYRMLSSGSAADIVSAALTARQEPGEKTITVAGDARQYDGAVSAAISQSVKVPDLAKMGYQLSSIRFYPGAAGGSAAELLYHDQTGRLFTLYLRHSDGKARFDQFQRAGLRVCIWQDDQLGMVMAGNVTTAAMQRLASLAYAGLTL